METNTNRLEEAVETCFTMNLAWAIALLLEGNKARSASAS